MVYVHAAHGTSQMSIVTVHGKVVHPHYAAAAVNNFWYDDFQLVGKGLDNGLSVEQMSGASFRTLANV